MKKASDVLTHACHGRRSRCHSGAPALMATALLLQGCVTNAPSCEGHFEPINHAASGQESTIEDSTSKAQEHAL